MNKYLSYVKEFHENNKREIDFVNNQLAKHLKTSEENQTEIEHILDYLYSNNVDISKIGYKTIKEKADKWNKKLQQMTSKDTEIEGEDYDVVHDFNDGFRIVKLKSKSSYTREGKLMSHCVGSYADRGVDIYSLRDKDNKPHCTMEGGQQVKGKGNGKIHPNYITYVVKFLEINGMTIRESEMKNLGYYSIEPIKDEIDTKKTPLYDGKYIYSGDKDKIIDKKGVKYYGMKLLDMFDLLTENLKIDFDVKLLVDWQVNNTKSSILGKKSISNDKRDAKIGSSGDYAQIGSSGDYAQIGSSGDYAQIGSSGDYAQIGSSGYSAKIGSSGYSAKIGSSGYSAKIGSSGDYAQIGSSGYSAKIGITGEKSVGANIGIQGKIKGVIGTWITLAEYKKNKDDIYECVYVKSAQIDGKKLKENVWYELKNKKFVEVE